MTTSTINIKVGKTRRSKNQPKLKKIICEICGFNKPRALNIHHIIPRADSRCTNNNNNLAIVCASCHALVHSGDITIIGVYPNTNPQSQFRHLMFFRKEETPPLPKEFWKIHPEDNPLVVIS